MNSRGTQHDQSSNVPEAVTASERRVLDAIDMDGLVSFLQMLVRIPSVTGSDAESEPQAHIAEWMTKTRFDVDLWPLDFSALAQHPAYSAEYERTHGEGVAGVMGEDTDGNHLILNGHVDVVPTGDPAAWQDPPFQGVVRNNSVYGRGALDMKGGLCAALFAAKAIRDARIALKGRLTILSVIGEEDGGVGTLAAAVRGYQADGAIVMEPTDHAIVPAQAGALNFRITVPGLAAHGAVREAGVSAFEKFIPIHEAIMRLEQKRNHKAASDRFFERYPRPYPICIGTVRSGEWASSVPGSFTCEGRFGVSIEEDLDDARRLFERTIADAANADPWLHDHPPTVVWWGAQFQPARIPTDAPIVSAVCDAHQRATHHTPRVEGVPYGSDMRLLVNQAHTPTVLYGPGSVTGAHRPDEHIAIADLHTTAQTLALVAMRFCGQASRDGT